MSDTSLPLVLIFKDDCEIQLAISSGLQVSFKPTLEDLVILNKNILLSRKLEQECFLCTRWGSDCMNGEVMVPRVPRN